MHLLTSFIGAVGNLMTDTGFADILFSGFAGVPKMMMGEKFPVCRALRIVVEMILAPVIANVHCYDGLMEVLEEMAGKSKTCKMWHDCIINPVFIMMRAEHEGNWALHVKCK